VPRTGTKGTLPPCPHGKNNTSKLANYKDCWICCYRKGGNCFIIKELFSSCVVRGKNFNLRMDISRW
jgi:hypothetical protein